MIDFNEISDFEQFEDLCEDLLLAKGLRVRRLGRGPGQLGKDIIAEESYVGTLASPTVKTWLVEAKFTSSDRAINEHDVMNILDRVISQKATGYLLFTNARLSVNLERTLTDLNSNSEIDVISWERNTIKKEILGYPHVFRKFFPVSYSNFIRGNRIFFLSQTRSCKSPLTYTLSSLFLIKGVLSRSDKETLLHYKPLIETKIDNLTKLIRLLIDEVDEFCNTFTTD